MTLTFRRLDVVWRVALGVLLGLIALGVVWTVIFGGLLLFSSEHHSSSPPVKMPAPGHVLPSNAPPR